MPTDRFVYLINPWLRPSTEEIEELLTRFMGGVGTVEWNTDRFYVSVPGKPQDCRPEPYRRPDGCYQEERWFEVWPDPEGACIDVMTRQTDDFTSALAGSVADILKRVWWGHDSEMLAGVSIAHPVFAQKPPYTKSTGVPWVLQGAHYACERGAWSVDMAKRFLATVEHPVVPHDITGMAAGVKAHAYDPRTRRRKVDLTLPLIGLDLPSGKLIIDGHRRVKLGLSKKLRTLPSVWLTAEEACRIDAEDDLMGK